MSQKPLSRPVLQSARALALLIALALLVAWGYSIWKETPKPPPGEPVTVLWTFEPPERGAIISTPAVTTDGDVYVAAIHDAGLATFGAVYRLDRETHKVVWKFDDDGAMQHMYSSPCLAGGRLYIGEGMHANNVCKLYCLDVVTGRKVWHFLTSGHIESSPCVAGGKVYFGAGDDGIYCLDALSGKERWHFQEPAHIDANPVVIGKRLYVGSGVSRAHKTSAVFCLNSESGTVIWATPTDLPAWGSPAVDGSDVFIGLGNGRLVKSVDPPETPSGALLDLDAQTGKLRWRYPVSDAVLAKAAFDAEHV